MTKKAKKIINVVDQPISDIIAELEHLIDAKNEHTFEFYVDKSSYISDAKINELVVRIQDRYDNAGYSLFMEEDFESQVVKMVMREPSKVELKQTRKNKTKSTKAKPKKK